MTIAIPESTYSLPDKIEFANALSAARIIPRAFQGQPADVLVAIELGHALGIAPIVAINEVNVINGSPSLSASLMAALARQAGHKVRVAGDGKSATCVIVRADDPTFEHSATWDEAKARAAGLWGKGHWSKDAATMLKWRAIAECVRFACSEVLGGIKYTPEEISDFTPAAPAVNTKPQSISEVVASKTGDPVDDKAITQAQSKKMFALARETGLSDSRDEMLAWIGNKIGRFVTSSKDLTKVEAGIVIDALEQEQAQSEAVEAEIVEPETGELPMDDGWPEVATAGRAS